MSVIDDFNTLSGKPKTFKQKVVRAAWVTLTYIVMIIIFFACFATGMVIMSCARGG